MGVTQIFSGRKTPPVLHTCDESKGFKCDGKRCFEVLMRKHRFSVETRFWCDVKRGYFDPASVSQCERWANDELEA